MWPIFPERWGRYRTCFFDFEENQVGESLKLSTQIWNIHFCSTPCFFSLLKDKRPLTTALMCFFWGEGWMCTTCRFDTSYDCRQWSCSPMDGLQLKQHNHTSAQTKLTKLSLSPLFRDLLLFYSIVSLRWRALQVDCEYHWMTRPSKYKQVG